MAAAWFDLILQFEMLTLLMNLGQFFVKREGYNNISLLITPKLTLFASDLVYNFWKFFVVFLVKQLLIEETNF